MSGTMRDPWAAFEEVTPVARTEGPRERPAAPVDPWAQFDAVEPQQPQRWGGMPLDIAQQALRGATFGYQDEIASAVGATGGGLSGMGGTWSERYNRLLAENRGRQKEFETTHPYVALGAQVGGAMANPVSRLSAGTSFLGRVGSNALINGLLGGVTGFGEGEGGFVNRLGPAGTGAATGAVLGAAVPAAVEGIGKGVRAIAPSMGVNVAGTDAKRKLVDALANGGRSIDDVTNDLRGAGNQPMALVDVGGEDVLGMAQHAARKPGPAMVAAKEFVDQRGGLNQSARLEGEVQRAVSGKDWQNTIDDIVSARGRAAKGAYDTALAVATPVETAPIVASIDARIDTAKGPVRDALRKARAVLLNRDGAPDTTMPGLHESKLALDALLDRSAKNPIDRVARGEIIEVQKSLVAAMDAASQGEYAAARQAWAGPSRMKDAAELGRSILSGKDFDETAAAIKNMTASEKEMLRVGLARSLVDRVKGTGDTKDITALQNIWGNQAVRERIASAFDDPAEFEKFADFMKREMTMAKTNASVDPRSGSITAKLLMRDAEPPPVGPIIQAARGAMRADPMAMVAALMPKASGPPSLSAETAAELAPYLFSLKPGDRARLVDNLLKQQTRDQRVKRIADPVANALMRGATVGAVQLEN
jgi:hypothetical protein